MAWVLLEVLEYLSVLVSSIILIVVPLLTPRFQSYQFEALYRFTELSTRSLFTSLPLH
jgi:capsular polysaccharide biosynthesis protein